MTTEEIAEAEAQQDVLSKFKPLPTAEKSVLDWANNPESKSELVWLALQRPPDYIPRTLIEERLISTREVRTTSDFDMVRQDALAEHQTRVAKVLQRFTKSIKNTGRNTISSDVDAMKAIIYWYDRRHENGTAVANIDFGLQKKVGSSWITVRESKDAYDNVERIYWSDFSSNTKWRLRIKGTYVSSDNAGCGQNSMRVRLVQFHEDSDREYWENLDDVEVE